ncbi:3D domain-containing protein [Tigheibacillus jepli]|uniref:3D domain-containing protein n=1 Tax=Tigheibacillus jepli TaxID=3035914 RepID=UPI00387E0670
MISLGTEVYVEGYGHAIAGDTGSAIKGNKIDIYFPNEAQARNWGTRTVDITIQ